MELKELLITWGGWLLAVILGILKISEHFRDRANIKVTVQGNYEVYPKNTPYGDATLLAITAVNVGRRPVTLTRAALLMPKNSKSKYLLFANSVTDAVASHELTEGKSRDYIINEDVLKKEDGLIPSKYVACVYDATGKCYWSHNWLARLIKLGRIK